MSRLSIATGHARLGTHTMEVTVYHRRGSQSYVPLAHASSTFTITGEISERNTGRRAGRGCDVGRLARSRKRKWSATYKGEG